MQLVIVFVACVLVAGWDWAARRVPNNLLIVLAVTQGLLLTIGRAQVDWTSAVVGLFLGLFALLPFYAARWMGAGDVKYGTLIGLMCGPKLLCLAWLIAGLLAGLHVLLGLSVIGNPVLMRAHERWRKAYVGQRLSVRREGRSGIPYAAYLSVGVVYWQFLHRIS